MSYGGVKKVAKYGPLVTCHFRGNFAISAL